MHRNDHHNTLKKLSKKVIEGKATEAEKHFLEEYYALFERSNASNDFQEKELESIGKELEYRISETITTPAARHFHLFTPMRVAASVALLMLLGTAAYFKLQPDDKPQQSITVATSNKPAEIIVAGGNKATLTLADGSKVVLDDAQNGVLSAVAGVSISKNAKGEINYSSTAEKSAPNQINILETPRGGIYQVTLADGTHVWLNSASRLKYPVSFSANERRVELEGEAYFEVAHRDKQPFRVISNKQTIEVLGTHFNVSTYPEQTRTRTTLLEGSVKVMSADSQSHTTLKPGQEAATDGSTVKTRNVDTDLAVAWKEGLFRFDHDDIQTIMNKISRWYDVDVIYRDDVKDIRFGGSVSRFSDIEKVLNKLELTNTIHFKIEGRRIYVMK